MADGRWLIVGLGNPGNEFVATRHNIGWEALDELALRLGWIGKKEDFNRLAKSKFDGLVLDGSISIHSGKRFCRFSSQGSLFRSKGALSRRHCATASSLTASWLPPG